MMEVLVAVLRGQNLIHKGFILPIYSSTIGAQHGHTMSDWNAAAHPKFSRAYFVLGCFSNAMFVDTNLDVGEVQIYPLSTGSLA